MKISFSLLTFLTVIALSSCKKDKTEPKPEPMTNAELQNKILNDFAYKVALTNYQDLENKMNTFHDACVAFNASSSQTNLEQGRSSWKEVRGAWEQCEAFLFGPVSTNNIDPSTDTWPVDYKALDSLLKSGKAFTPEYINSLGDELKGYHPTEYLLWGTSGNKLSKDFTDREKEYLIALVGDLQKKATSLYASWDPATSNNYSEQIINAGKINTVYSSQKAVFEELVNGMTGICDEVANGKITDPFKAADPSLEESPFSQNSLVDFKNNIAGVKNVYFGKYESNDGYGINDFLTANNLALHNTIAAQIEDALNSFSGITVPFGQAITTQPTQVQNVINKINTLKETLEVKLLPYVQQSIIN